METVSRKKSFWQRILGKCSTRPPVDASSWTHGDGKVIVDLARASELQNPGGAIRLEGNGFLDRVLVVHGHDGVFHAYHNDCPHGGRRIDPVGGEARLECCSVGKSTFDYNGTLLSGSAKGNLRVYPLEIVDGKLIVKVG